MPSHNGPNGKTSKTKSRPFDPPERFGWGFNADKGTLTFYSPSAIRTYRAAPPACWYKSDVRPNWVGSFGAEDFQIGQLADVSQRCKVRLDVDFKAGYYVRRPGLLAMKRFFARLDPEAAALTAPLSHNSWLLYCLLVRAPQVREIAADSLGLAMLMAVHRRDRRHRFDRIGRLTRLKRRDIIGACGLPAQKQWVKLLGRIAIPSLSLVNLSQLRQLPDVAPDAIERLRHLPTLNGGVIRLLHSRLGQHAHASLLEEVANDPWQHHNRWSQRNRTEGTLHDTAQMLRSLASPVPIFRSMAELQEAHDEAAARCIERRPRQMRPFALPPLPESKHIVALRSPLELRQEAAAQRNCLSLEFWADRCYWGQIYMYRITHPERASVALQRRPNGRWTVLEFKARFNAEPSRATVRAVQAWLRDGHRALAKGWRSGDPVEPTVTGLEDVA